MSALLTLREARDRVERIRLLAGDAEAAHGQEDNLWRLALEYVAAGGHAPREMARIALSTTAIDFERWCA